MEKQALASLFGLMVIGFVQDHSMGTRSLLQKKPEAWAILTALKEASSSRLCKSHLLSDALQVICSINGSLDWSIHPILLDIKDLSVGFYTVAVTHLAESLKRRCSLPCQKLLWDG